MNIPSVCISPCWPEMHSQESTIAKRFWRTHPDLSVAFGTWKGISQFTQLRQQQQQRQQQHADGTSPSVFQSSPEVPAEGRPVARALTKDIVVHWLMPSVLPHYLAWRKHLQLGSQLSTATEHIARLHPLWNGPTVRDGPRQAPLLLYLQAREFMSLPGSVVNQVDVPNEASIHVCGTPSGKIFTAVSRRLRHSVFREDAALTGQVQAFLKSAAAVGARCVFVNFGSMAHDNVVSCGDSRVQKMDFGANAKARVGLLSKKRLIVDVPKMLNDVQTILTGESSDTTGRFWFVFSCHAPTEVVAVRGKLQSGSVLWLNPNSYVDHAALFPHFAAVVHHGGAGTTMECIKAGIPQVICPVLFDQFRWAAQVEWLNLGVSVGALASVTAPSLCRAIRSCTIASASLRENCRRYQRMLGSQTCGAEIAARHVLKELLGCIGSSKVYNSPAILTAPKRKLIETAQASVNPTGKKTRVTRVQEVHVSHSASKSTLRLAVERWRGYTPWQYGGNILYADGASIMLEAAKRCAHDGNAERQLYGSLDPCPESPFLCNAIL